MWLLSNAGIDLETNTAVDIKFGTGEHEFWFKREYKNFQQLKADGEFNLEITNLIFWIWTHWLNSQLISRY